jgi:ABC-type sulfate transport system substrate-binding protein
MKKLSLILTMVMGFFIKQTVAQGTIVDQRWVTRFFLLWLYRSKLADLVITSFWGRWNGLAGKSVSKYFAYLVSGKLVATDVVAALKAGNGVVELKARSSVDEVMQKMARVEDEWQLADCATDVMGSNG